MVGNKVKTGFTIIELLVVIVVIGILVTISIGVSTGYLRNAADSATKTSLEDAARRLDAYKIKNGFYQSAGLTGYTPQTNVTLTQQSITDTAYCLKAAHTQYPTIIYYKGNTGTATTTSC